MIEMSREHCLHGTQEAVSTHTLQEDESGEMREEGYSRFDGVAQPIKIAHACAFCAT